MTKTIYEDIFDELIKIYDKICELQGLVQLDYDPLFVNGEIRIRVPIIDNLGTKPSPTVEGNIRTQFIEFNNWLVTLQQSIPLPVPLPPGFKDADRLKIRPVLGDINATFASIKLIPFRSIDAPKATAEMFRDLKALFPQGASGKIPTITAPKLWDKDGNLVDSGTDDDWKVKDSATDDTFKDLESYINGFYPELTKVLKTVIDFGKDTVGGA